MFIAFHKIRSCIKLTFCLPSSLNVQKDTKWYQSISNYISIQWYTKCIKAIALCVCIYMKSKRQKKAISVLVTRGGEEWRGRWRGLGESNTWWQETTLVCEQYTVGIL